LASQGPLDNTVHQFWTAIDQYKVDYIFALCGLTEGSAIKCNKYWPDKIGDSIKISPCLAVKFINESEWKKGSRDLLIREFSLSNSNVFFFLFNQNRQK